MAIGLKRKKVKIQDNYSDTNPHPARALLAPSLRYSYALLAMPEGRISEAKIANAAPLPKMV